MEGVLASLRRLFAFVEVKTCNRDVTPIIRRTGGRQNLAGDFTHDPVVELLVPNDLAAIVTEIVRESLVAFGAPNRIFDRPIPLLGKE